MVNGNKQQSLFSNPLVLFLVGVGVALIAVVLAVMVLQPGGQLKTATYSSPSSSTTSAPVKDRCACACLAQISDTVTLCPTKRGDDGVCSDDSYEYMDITDQKACENKNGKSCRGYAIGLNQAVYGTLADCEVTSAAVSPTPTSSP